jgi:hypothetical protein
LVFANAPPKKEAGFGLKPAPNGVILEYRRGRLDYRRSRLITPTWDFGNETQKLRKPQLSSPPEVQSDAGRFDL